MPSAADRPVPPERARTAVAMPSARAAVTMPGARAAIAAVATGFVALPALTESALDPAPGSRPPPAPDPLGWPGYPELVAGSRARTGEAESVVCGTGLVDGVEAVLISFDFRFVGGSVGAGAGQRIFDAFETARTRRLPVVSLVASGGSRIQEGMVSLHQLHRVAAQIARGRADGIPHIAVLRDPTTGGTWATLGAGADVTLAVAGAQIGFAGRRVRSPDDEGAGAAFTAAGQYAAGNVDAIVAAEEVPAVLARWLRLLLPRPATPPDPVEPPPALGTTPPPMGGWATVLAARSAERPRAADYLASTFDVLVQISGDRCGGRDPGMLCGIGRHEGRTVAFAAQAGSPTTPAGYRTATRLVRLADRFGLPVLTLVDTPGAAADADAEAAGLAAAIAELFTAIADATVPITTLVIGEGGSGGALALAASDATWIAPHAYFSVIAPELAARILKLDPDAAPALADRLRLRPPDLRDLGLARQTPRHGARGETPPAP